MFGTPLTLENHVTTKYVLPSFYVHGYLRSVCCLRSMYMCAHMCECMRVNACLLLAACVPLPPASRMGITQCRRQVGEYLVCQVDTVYCPCLYHSHVCRACVVWRCGRNTQERICAALWAYLAI